MLAMALAVVVLQEVLASNVDGPIAALVPLGLAFTLPLAWRRTAPVAALGVTMTAWVVLGGLESTQEPQTPLIPILLAVYSVGAHVERRAALAGLAVAVAGLLLKEAGDVVVMGPVFTGTWLAGRLVRARERDAERLGELAAALERERVEEARIAVAEERARMARELHDVVAHAMSVIVLQAGAERLNLPPQSESTDAALRSIERTGREALAEMRRLVGMLREDGEEATLVPRPSLAHVEILLEQTRKAGLPVELRVVGEPVELAPGLDMSAYRIVQEALTNVLKHAGDARATVVLDYGPRTLAIEVADDGRGGTPNGTGHGITGMRQRVTLFGGELEAGPADGGFVVRARLPLEAER
jgi:signal transduction histidine kinase